MVLADVTKTTVLTGNTPLWLNDPQTMWMVESGAVGLFAIRIQQGIPEGQRRYLFNVYAGDALFGAAPSDQPGEFGLVAIALEPTELRAVPIRYPIPAPGSRERHPVDQQPLTQLDGWVHKMGRISGLPSIGGHTFIPDTHYVSPPDHEWCISGRDRVLWIRVMQGTARWMGDASLVLNAESPCFPVGSGMGLEASDQLEFYTRDTAEVEHPHILWLGLAELHAYVLTWLNQAEAVETAAGYERFQQRQQLNRQVTEDTLKHLSSVLQPQPDAYLQADTPLLAVAGAVGKALNLSIEPPQTSEDLKRVKEPLEAIARASRLRLRRVLLRGEWWRKDAGPLITYTRSDRHPVALLPVGGDRYEMFDPIRAGLGQSGVPTTMSMSGRVSVDAQVAEQLDPLAFMLYRPLPEGRLNAWTFLKFALQGRSRDLIAIVLTGVLTTLLGMVVPQATAVLIDQAIPYGNLSLIGQMGIGLLAAAFGAALFQLAQGIASIRVETLSDASLQAAVWDRLLKLQTSFFRQYSVGDLSSRVSAISAIRRKLSGTVLQSIFASFFSLLNLGLLFYYSPSLATLALLVAVLIMGFTVSTGAVLIRKQRPLMEIEGELFGQTVQLINAVPKLRIAAVEERAFAQWGREYTKQLHLLLSTQRLEDWVDVFNTVMPTITTVLLFWLASTLINPDDILNGGALSAGTFLAFSVAYGVFIRGATSLSNTLIEVLGIVPLWQRAQPILDAKPEVSQGKADPGRLTGRIQLDHVTFRYRDEGALILDDVSIHAEPGEFIALVGPSGSGKSTVMRLMLGFETPISGTVYFDGQDLSGLDVSAVRRQLGVVLQNGRINAGTIFENISSGAVMTLDDAWVAAEMAGFADDVRSFPMQLHTLVSEGGTNLSGGQRQRLVIARSLALKPRVLLLDEATSALDNRTQAIVTESMNRLKVTRIVVAHRLSTIQNADRIYVLAGGRVVQQGTFQELAAQPGLFAQLISRQLA